MFKHLFKVREKRTADELELISFIIKKFAYRPKNLKYFIEAVTHRSMAASSSAINYSNERLEFLGDTILDAVVAELLYLKFPTEDEGYLTKIKSKIVSRKTLSEIAELLDLKTILRYNKSRSINISTLEGNAFEALIGAIYLDGGFEAAKKTLTNHIFRKYADLTKILEEEIDFKSRLFIWCQKSRLALEFSVVREENIQGSWQYEIQVLINDKMYGKGIGSSKKAAEQQASKETLALVGELDD